MPICLCISAIWLSTYKLYCIEYSFLYNRIHVSILIHLNMGSTLYGIFWRFFFSNNFKFQMVFYEYCPQCQHILKFINFRRFGEICTYINSYQWNLCVSPFQLVNRFSVLYIHIHFRDIFSSIQGSVLLSLFLFKCCTNYSFTIIPWYFHSGYESHWEK